MTPFSPLASGRLARDWKESTQRSETDHVQKAKYDVTADTDRLVVKRVASLAEKHGVPRVQIALAWLLHKEPVTALSIKLTPEEIAFLEEPCVPHPVYGFNVGFK